MGIFDKIKKDDNTQKEYLYNQKNLNQFEEFITEVYGEYTSVINIDSPQLKVDILVFPPNESGNFYKLVTRGMGAYEMKVPNELYIYQLERAELVMYLPPDWNIDSKEKEDLWPIECIKSIAKIPIENNSWLGYGDTFENENNLAYSKNSSLCAIILADTVDRLDVKLKFIMKRKGRINFYQLVPIYKEELEYKNSQDTFSLLDLFDKKDSKYILDLNRKNYALENNNEDTIKDITIND